MTGLNLEGFLHLLRADLGAWVTLGLIAGVLALMAWTSWGSRRALRKCLVLSVLAHCGLALYGGVPRREAEGQIRQVARIEARIVQRRRIEAGARVGYGGTFVAEGPCELAILNIGYADGYLRGFSNSGRARIGDGFAPVVGRVSMDLTAIRVDATPELAEGDWVELDYDLPTAAAQSGLSQYELLTTLGSRFGRTWR